MSLGGMHPSMGKEVTLGEAFPKYGGDDGGVNREFQDDFGNVQ